MKKRVVNDIWKIEHTESLSCLVIEKGGRIEAPDGKNLVMTVDGISEEPTEGSYEGNIVLSVSERLNHPFKRMSDSYVTHYKTAIYVKDGKYQSEYSVPAAIMQGKYGDSECRDVLIQSELEDFNGIIVENGTYEIDRFHADFTSHGDDSVGVGAAILVFGQGKAIIRDSVIRTNGASRSALTVLEHGEAELHHCRLHAEGPVLSEEEKKRAQEEERPWIPPWQIGLRGTCRTVSMDDSAKVSYYDCHVTAHDWGLLSVDDDSPKTRIYGKNSVFEVLGNNGYGCFGIYCDVDEDYQDKQYFGSYHVYEHCTFRIPTYLMYMSVGKTGAEYLDGTIVESRQFGICAFRSSGGYIKIADGTKFHTGRAALVIKGSAVRIDIDHADIVADNGTILQLMDNDDPGHLSDRFEIPTEEDRKDPDRDLTKADTREDVLVTAANTELTGNFFNATTNRIADRLPEPEEVTEVPPNFVRLRGVRGKDLQGAKNLKLQIRNAKITGLITSASGRYKKNISVIDCTNCEEMSNIRCEASAAVNNGVIVSLDRKSVWEVTGDCYLTSLTIEKGAVLKAEEGKMLQLCVNGILVDPMPGTYKGDIYIGIS